MAIVNKSIRGYYVEKMVKLLEVRHPLPGKIVVFQPVYQKRMHSSRKKKTWCYACIYLEAPGPIVRAKICVGSKRYPVSDYGIASAIAHEYRHALQVFRDGKVYDKDYDEELEADARAFENELGFELIMEKIENSIKACQTKSRQAGGLVTAGQAGALSPS